MQTVLILSYLILFYPILAGYFIKLGRIAEPKPGQPLKFDPQYRNNGPTGAGFQIGVKGFATIYR